jgi:glutamate-5-semialdehyde dehydrogenase
MELRTSIEREAEAANHATAALQDELVADALRTAAAFVRERRTTLLAANAADVDAATGRLDEGTLDRLRLDDDRVESLARQAEAMAGIEQLEREAASWTLPNGLQVSERRIPIGTVGANFEARPNVALDVAGQLLKSLNTVVLRTGGAALRTVTTLVDDVLRPALETAGLPPGAVGLVRSPDREGARILVSLPRRIPLVILRGSGGTTAALSRVAAEHGVRTLAHAEGGGVLYVHGSASREKALALADASVDRLGVCNRLNLALVDREALEIVPDLLELFARRGLEVRGSVDGALPLDRPLGYEWANDPERVASVTVAVVDSLEEAVRIANEETSGLAAGIVAEDESAAESFLDGYRGTAAFWHATTRFTDGFELTGAPETGINVDWTPGPRGPVTYRDLWLRQYRIVGDGSQRR